MQIYGALEGTRGCNRLFILFILFFIIIIIFFFHVPSGASNLYFSHSNFLFLVPSRGIKCLFFDQ